MHDLQACMYATLFILVVNSVCHAEILNEEGSSTNLVKSSVAVFKECKIHTDTNVVPREGAGFYFCDIPLNMEASMTDLSLLEDSVVKMSLVHKYNYLDCIVLSGCYLLGWKSRWLISFTFLRILSTYFQFSRGSSFCMEICTMVLRAI